MNSKRILLIGGVSHVGKSTIAQSLLDSVGDYSCLRCDYISTDKMARHPGRPWQAKLTDIPKHVADHYELLSANELIDDVFTHYRNNVWPSIEDIVNSHVTDISTGIPTGPMAIEGSALLPELVINLNFDCISSVWLTASNDFLKSRIYTSSQYATKSTYEKMLIDKFCERNCLLNDHIITTVNRLGLFSFDVENVCNLDELISLCMVAFR